jgi:paraquat-inducible protein B
MSHAPEQKAEHTPEPKRTTARTRSSWWPGWIWAVPIAAVLVVGWLAFRALAEGRSTVTVTFDQAPGVRKTDTKVVYRGVDVGQVKSVGLAPGGRQVEVKLAIDKQAEPLLRAGTRFWLIGANPRLENIAELKDALTGPEIGLEPGGGAAAKIFRGLDEPPDEAPVGPQAPYRVRFDGPAGALKPGAPVLFDGFRVGRVMSSSLHYNRGDGALSADADLMLEPMRLGLGATGPDSRAATDAMLDRLIKRGLRAELAQSPPLIGPREVDLDFAAPRGTMGLQTIGDDRFIPTATGADLKAIEAKAGALESKVGAILDRVDAVPIGRIGADVRAATARIKTLVQSPDIDRTLAQVDDATAGIDRAVKAASPQIGPLIDKLRQTADHADQAVGQANKIIGGDPANQDSDLPSALRQLARAGRALRDLADELERRPESLVKGRPKESQSQ